MMVESSALTNYCDWWVEECCVMERPYRAIGRASSCPVDRCCTTSLTGLGQTHCHYWSISWTEWWMVHAIMSRRGLLSAVDVPNWYVCALHARHILTDRTACYKVWSAIGVIQSSVCLSVRLSVCIGLWRLLTVDPLWPNFVVTLRASGFSEWVQKRKAKIRKLWVSSSLFL